MEVKFTKLRRRLDKPTLTWLIVRAIPAISDTTRKCALYLHEKLEILMYLEPEEPLNKHSEIMFRYPNQRRYLFSNHDKKD